MGRIPKIKFCFITATKNYLNYNRKYMFILEGNIKTLLFFQRKEDDNLKYEIVSLTYKNS